MLTQTYEDGDTVTYTYDNDGALAEVYDSATGITTRYYYDLTGRQMKYSENGTGYSHSVGYEYDTRNNLSRLVEYINGTERTTTYTYDDDNRIKTSATGNITVAYDYDSFGRVSTQTTRNGSTVILTESYTYKASASTTTSAQIATYTTAVPNGYTVIYSYTYDDNGNITGVSDGTNTITYVYDSANQLIRENNQAGGFTYTWTYDNAGNILTRKEYAYTTGSLESQTPTDTAAYTYGNGDWGDLLTAYDGSAITYDGIGNTLNDGEWTYTWEHGRELAGMSKAGTTWTYTYNADGLRTKRTNGTTAYSYTYNGGSLSQMTVGTDTLNFAYDANGIPLAVTYNGATYYYVTNLQGDVVAILDSTGTAVVSYTYDAWGNILTTTGSVASTLGTLNPLRYRGYIYDTETGLYYISSRYYDPEIGRWINADNQIAGVGGEILGYNMFAYCMNNPVNMSDPSGSWPKWIKNTVKWVAKNIVKPVVKTVQKTLSKVDLTYSTGVNVSGTPSAWILNGQIGVFMDAKGNVAIQASGGGGITGGDPGISITHYQSVTNAPNIDKLNDAYYQVGGSIAVPIEGVPVAAGGDVMFMPDPELKTGYFGLTGNVGFGTPGKEFHVEWGTTVTLPYTQFNVYEVARSVYIKIMEW